MGIKLLLANGMIVSDFCAEQFEMCFSVPVLHTDLGACGLPSPNVISPSGHAFVRPGQCFQMRQTDPHPPTDTTAAATLSQTVEYTLGELSTEEDASILN